MAEKDQKQIKVNNKIAEFLLNYGVKEEYSIGEVVVEEGEISNFVYIILNGNADVSVKDRFGDKVKLAELGKGTVFGEMGCFLENVRTATVSASSESLTVLKLKNEIFQEALYEMKEFTKRVMHSFAERVELHNNLYSSAVREKLYLVIGYFVLEKLGYPSEGGYEFEFKYDEIRKRFGIEAFKIVEAVQGMHKLGIINRIQGAKTVVKIDPEHPEEYEALQIDMKEVRQSILVNIDIKALRQYLDRISYVEN